MKQWESSGCLTFRQIEDKQRGAGTEANCSAQMADEEKNGLGMKETLRELSRRRFDCRGGGKSVLCSENAGSQREHQSCRLLGICRLVVPPVGHLLDVDHFLI